MPRDASPPITRNAGRTQAAILDAATHEFARHGLGGARVDQIAARAHTNKRMLYYYFGDKDDLFLAVLERAYEHIRGEEQKLRLTDLPPAQGVTRLIRFTWKYFLAHPEFITLLNSENLHRATHLKRSRKIRAMHSPLLATLSEVLVRGAREGVFRRNVDPMHLYVSIAALGYFYLSNNPTLSTIFGRDLMAPRARSARLAHIEALVLGYLAPPSEEGPPRSPRSLPPRGRNPRLGAALGRESLYPN
ncbi:MAG: TetR/AcrR family transcriptional regulator [Burkholderiales bacterium]